MRGNALEARLTHSKTIGADRNLSHRLVLVSEHCYIRKQNWLSCGWQLLTKKADFQRDYLLPAPSGNLKGCQQRELRYDTAYALQKRVMDVLVSDGQKLFAHGAGHFWSPHSGRNFLPSAAGALNVNKSDRDMLGGWMLQESDRYNRVARVRIRAVQAQVAKTFSDREKHDPLLEGDTIEEFRLFLQKQGCSAEVQNEYIQKVSRRAFAFLPRVQEVPEEEGVSEQMEPGNVQQLEEDEVDKELEAARRADVRKRQQAWNNDRSSKLGNEPREARRLLRESLQPGFYIATSSKKKIKTLHLLGSCYMIPVIDYPSFSHAGERFPNRRTFHGVCKWCARDRSAQDPRDHSSDTVTSSSTEDASFTRAVSHATHWWIRWRQCHVRSGTLRGGRVCGKALS